MKMTTFLKISVAASGWCLLSACASYPGNLHIGMTRDQVLTRFGPPTAERKDSDGVIMIFSTAPFGQTAYAARFGADGRVQEVEQVLREDQFARIDLGVWDKERVRANFGAPAELRDLSDGRSWWSYRYKQNGVWEMLMNILFDDQGKVRQLINTPDPMFDSGDTPRM